MTRRIQAKKTIRKRYSKEFKDEALALAERLAVPAAAKELGLHESRLYGWRVKARADSDQSETERNQAAEIARLKRKVAERRRPTCLADTIKPFIPFPRQLPKGSARSSAGLVPRVAEQVGLAKEQG